MSVAEFGEWALSTERTDEEAYFAERVVEFASARWRARNNVRDPLSFDEKQEEHKRRRLNPAYRARLDKTDVEHAVTMLTQMSDMHLESYSDRPIRDLTGLRFMPHLKKLHIGTSEIADLTPLSLLTNLEELHLSDDVAEDLRPLAALTKLRSLWINVRQPWPRVDGWNALQALEMFRWNGNLLVLEGLGPFPNVREAHLDNWLQSLPTRDATRLPEMPAVEILHIKGLYRLDGIERWPQVVNLELEGSFRTLQPLTALTRVTHLHIHNDQPLDLAPLCKLPELRSFKLTSLQPQELFVLTDAPQLHEVVVARCEANDREAATLQEVLKPWDDDFLAPQPRSLPSWRLIAEKWGEGNTVAARRNATYDLPGTWPGNPAMKSSEEEWLARRLEAALDKQFHGPEWGKVEHGWAKVYNLEAAERLPEIVELIRQLLAQCRHPHCAFVNIDLKAQWHLQDQSWKDPEQEKLERERAEEEDWKIREREEAALREREHRLRQLRQEGAKIDPAEFEPPPDPPEIETGGGTDVLDDDDEDEPHPQNEDYRLFAEVNEDGVFIPDREGDVEVAERLLCRRAERQG
jgi:hypothetical protein